MEAELLIEEVCVPPLGMRFIWKKDLLEGTSLFWSSDERKGVGEAGKKIYSLLKRYLNKEPVDWSFLPLNWDKVSRFRRLVLKTLQDKVGFGEFVSYSELAFMCNIPKGARAVGQALRANPWPVVIPCHRVLGKDGFIGGFSCGIEFKRFLLKLEGIIWKE